MTATRKYRLLSVQPVSDGGGSEHALIGMIRELTAAGWECHVVLPSPARLEREYAAAGARLHLVAMERLTTVGGPVRWVRYAARWPLSVYRLWRLVRLLDPDVVHSNSLHSWYGWAAARLGRRPHVWHAREIVFQSGVAVRVERFLARRFADRVVAVSAAVAGQLHPANVTVATDEADPSRFHPGRAGRFRLAEGLADSVPVVASVGRIDVWKGFGVLLDAWPLVRRDRPEAVLVVAGGVIPGKDGYAREMEARAAGTPGVRWLGPRQDVPDLMADADVFVLASTEPEPFGLVVVEALASGTPVVATAAGGPLEILSGQPAGRLVPPGDPAALARAVVELLPSTTSTTARLARTPLRRSLPGRFASLFEEVAGQRSARAATSR